MNAVEIEEAISALAEEPFNVEAFPFAFLEAFGNKATTIKRLRSGASNKSDRGGVLQTNNIHLKVCAPGDVPDNLHALRTSPATAKAKAKFILATDGHDLEAEDLTTGETIVCRYRDFPTISDSSCRWRASPPSSKSARAPSTSRRPGGSTVFMSSCCATTRIGAPPSAGTT